MSKKIISSVLILLILMTAIACGSGERQMTGDELLNGVLASMENQKTYRYKVSGTFSMSGTFEGEYGEIDFSMDGDGMVDLMDKKMLLDMTTTTIIRAGKQTEETSTIKENILGAPPYVGL